MYLGDKYYYELKLFFFLNLLSFETSALLHKNFGNLLEDVMIVTCKGVVLICEYVSCKPSNLLVKPSMNCDLYQSTHCFNSVNETK